MSEVTNISNLFTTQPTARGTTPASPVRPNSDARAEDRVEISDTGYALLRAAEESSLRIARVRAIRVEIDAGIYETPERIEGTVSRLLDILG